MNEIQSVFRGESSPEDLLQRVVSNTAKASDFFYSRLYMGLYYESRGGEGDKAKSLACIEEALQSPYAQQGGDYMVDVAKVHYKLRKPTT